MDKSVGTQLLVTVRWIDSCQGLTCYQNLKSYADKKRKYKDYQLGEHVYLKVKEKQSSLSLGMCCKLAPSFCGPFEILAKKGPMDYELALPAHVRVHNVFHAYLLNKYVYDTKHVINQSLLQVEPEGEFSHEPLHILDKGEVQLKKCTIVQLKLQQKHFEADEATWENEGTMLKGLPCLVS